MTFVRLPTPDSAGPELRDEYAAALEREGRIMQVLRAMGPRAEVLRAFLDLFGALMRDGPGLDLRRRELVAVTVSRINGARYSADVHERLLAEHGDADTLDAADRALVTFAERLSREPASVDQAVVDDLGRHFPDDAILEAIQVTAFFNYVNRVVMATGVPLEER
jgi:uncharacterized peroxidase-related enzyme